MTPGFGVTESLARERADRIADLRYAVDISIPERHTQRVAGRVTLAFTLRDAASPLLLDFAPNGMGGLKTCAIDGAALDVSTINGHIIVPSGALHVGAITVTIEFDAGDAPLNRRDDFVYTLFVPARAHEVFPCFDQPDLKARWTVVLEVPSHWQTLANGAETARVSFGERTRVSFAETAPLPTYLIAFAAGQWFEEERARNGRIIRVLHRETDRRKVERHVDAIVDAHASALDWLERYTGLPYPFGTFDVLLVPDFQFAGMEHPGAVFYDADQLLLDDSATLNAHLARASLIAHETSHMWFGGLVTMTWFNDVWIKEMFATFMAGNIVRPMFPNVDHDLRFLQTRYPPAYDVDRSGGAHGILQPLGNLRDAGTLYDAIIYHKAPIVARQLEALMGADSFQAAVQVYLRTYRFGNAAWAELLEIFGAHAAIDVAEWSRAWIAEPGRPHVRADLAVTDGRIAGLGLTSHDPRADCDRAWMQDLTVALGYDGREAILPVRVGAGRTEVAGARGLAEPHFVLPNGAGRGYGAFRLDTKSMAWLLRHLAKIEDPLTRGSAWLTLWDSMLDGDVRSGDLFDAALAALPREENELNVARMLADLDRLYWIFTDDAERLARAGDIERVLRDGMNAASTDSLRRTYFAGVQRVASTPNTIEWLTAIWRGDEIVPGLTLAESDRISLAEGLAIRAVPSWQAILERQVERTVGVDRQARLRFLLPALSPDAADRDRFFASIADLGNRDRERWVVDGLRFLHHPLRARSALPCLEASLTLLETIQHTGDIFFPARWMDAALSGHRSPDAAAIVRSFLDRAPGTYPPRLRRIILVASDQLFRASDRNSDNPVDHSDILVG